MGEEKEGKQVDEQKHNEQEQQVKQVEEKWVKYYSSLHKILLVGEGDFSFSTCLAQSFGSASNIVASSLESYDAVIKKYKNAESNLSILDKLGASHLHEVNAKTMKSNSNLSMREFDRIIFNFPHAGFYGKEDNSLLIGMHTSLLDGFFQNASSMLRPNGEIHVNHKTSFPYCHWNLKELASQYSLRLIECVAFKKEDYPGYENKRGDGPKCDERFPLGECCTFKFSFSPNAEVTKVKQNKKRPQNPVKSPKFLPRRRNSFEFRHSPSDPVAYMSGTPALNIPLGRSIELPQTLVHASHQQGNILRHGQPRELLPTPTCAYQQGNYHAYRHPLSDLVTFRTNNLSLNMPYGRPFLPLQTPICASQQGNFLEHVLPRELQSLIRSFRERHIQASTRANQQRHYPAYRCPPSDLNLQMSGIPGCNGSPHIEPICKIIFGGLFEKVVKALESPDHNSLHFLEKALQLGFKRYMDTNPRGSPSNYEYIFEQLCRIVVGRQAWQVSRQVTVENNLARYSRIGPSM